MYHGYLRGSTQTIFPSRPLGGWLGQCKTLLQVESTEIWGLCIFSFLCPLPSQSSVPQIRSSCVWVRVLIPAPPPVSCETLGKLQLSHFIHSFAFCSLLPMVNSNPKYGMKYSGNKQLVGFKFWVAWWNFMPCCSVPPGTWIIPLASTRTLCTLPTH